MIDILDFCRIRSVSRLQPSPDGRCIAFDVIQPLLEENRYRRELWLLPAAGGAFCVLPDGRYAGGFFWDGTDAGYALEAQTKEESTLVRLEMPSGRALGRWRIPVPAAEIFPLGPGEIACTATVSLRQEKHPPELAFLDEMDDAWDIIDEIPLWNDGRGFSSQLRQTLFSFSPADGALRRLTPPRRYVDAVRPVPGGLLYQARTYEGLTTEPGLYRWDAAVRTDVCLVPEGRYRIFEFCAADAGTVYFAAQDKTEKGMTDDLSFYAASAGTVRRTAIADSGVGDNNSTDCQYGTGTTFAWRGGLLYFLHTGVQDSFLLCADPAAGTVTALTPAGGSVSGFCLAGERIFVSAMRGQDFSELYALENGTLRAVTQVNAGVLAGEVLTPEPMLFENDGHTVYYEVLKPAGYDPDKKYPAVLVIHGGARVLYGGLFFHEMQLLASHGYFVLYGNPHGSDGQGSAFADLREHYGEKDFDDLMKAVDTALARYPAIDAERLGVEGGSYGGIMTNWCITHTHRFKAAVAQRSICNMMSTFGTADNGFGFVREQMGGDLWNGADRLWAQSPLKYADRCTTPLLLIHSTGDHRCDYSEAIQMFTALRYLGVEARICLIHGESHGLSRRGSPRQRVQRLYEMLRWLDRYLQPAGV